MNDEHSEAKPNRFVALCLLLALSAFVGCRSSTSTTPRPAVGSVIQVTATYPGASPEVLLDSVAIPLEHSIHGVEGMVRCESESRNDGRYVARLYFDSATDPAAARVLVQQRVDGVIGLFPPLVVREGISVTVGKLADEPKQVVIAVLDKGNVDRMGNVLAHSRGVGWNALGVMTDGVRKRLVADGVIVLPHEAPKPEKFVSRDIDLEKCKRLGISMKDVDDALVRNLNNPELDGSKRTSLYSIKVHGDTTYGELFANREHDVVTLFRVNRHSAIRITGSPPEGKSVAAAADKCIQSAEAALKDSKAKGFSVIDISER